MKPRWGLRIALALSLAVAPGCKLAVKEQVIQQLQAATGGGLPGLNVTPTPTATPNAPWVTYTASSGTTSYRAKGTVSGVNLGYIEYLPNGYASAPAGHYPLVIFLHGIGEQGDGSVASLTNYRNNTWNAAGVQYNIDHGKFYNAVVLTPQSGGWWNASEINQLVDSAVAFYKINPKRVLVTGLSMGGGGTWDYISAYASKIAAAIPICGASGCGTGAQNLHTQKVKVWAFHALDDWTVSYNNSVSCMNHIGAAMGQVGSITDQYDNASGADQTAHFSNSTKRWVWEPEIDCADSSGTPWNPQLCLTAYKSGGHGIWGRVYQHPTDAPLVWLLGQMRP